MSLSINSNILSLTAQRSLAASGSSLAKSLQRLSSGLRINSAADDAAGLAISTRMTTQIRGMSQAIRNANDGTSLLQTADGALASVTQNLQRIRELAVQAANGSNSAADRAALMAEAQQRLDEIDRVSKTAAFNGQQIFAQNGPSIGGDPTQRAVADGLRMGWLENSEQMIKQYYGLQADGAALNIDLTGSTDGPGGVAAFVSSSVGGQPGGRGTNLSLNVDMANFVPPNLPNGGSAPVFNDRIIAHEMTHAVMARTTNWQSLTSTSMWFVEGSAEFIHGADERVAADVAAAAGGTQNAKIQSVVDEVATWQLQSADYSAGYIATRYLNDKLKTAGFSGGIKDFMMYLNDPSAPTMDQALTHFFGGGYTQASFLTEVQANGVNYVNTKMNLTNADTGAVGGLDADGGPVKTADSVVADLGTHYGDDVLDGFKETWEKVSPGTSSVKTASLQVGSDVGQTIDVQIGAMGVNALGIDDVDLATSAFTAERSIAHLDDALEYVTKQRANLGAQLSRMDSAVSSLQTNVEAASGSRSRILDADYASETANMLKSQILQQAGVAIVAQANAMPQAALSLLKG